MLKKFNKTLRTLSRVFEMLFHLFNVTTRWCSICFAKNGPCLAKGDDPSNK